MLEKRSWFRIFFQRIRLPSDFKHLLYLLCPVIVASILLTNPIPRLPSDGIRPWKLYLVVAVVQHPDYDNTLLFVLQDQDKSIKHLSCGVASCDTVSRMMPRSLVLEAVPPPDSATWMPLIYRVRYNPFYRPPAILLPYTPTPGTTPPRGYNVIEYINSRGSDARP